MEFLMIVGWLAIKVAFVAFLAYLIFGVKQGRSFRTYVRIPPKARTPRHPRRGPDGVPMERAA